MQRRKPTRKRVVPYEKEEQIKLCTWLTRNNILFYHSPNGGSRNLLEAMNLKRLGVKSGIPDITIPVARKGYHSLYIELKRQRGGSISETQEYWLAALNKEGMLAILCHGADEAIERIKDYFDMDYKNRL